MSLPLVTAVAPRWEVDLAAQLARTDEVHVTRRCADVTELMGVAAAGLAGAALVSSDLRGLDRAVLDHLTEHDVLVLGVHPPHDENAERVLRRWGVPVVIPATSGQQELAEALRALIAHGEEAGDAAHREDDLAHESSGSRRTGPEPRRREDQGRSGEEPGVRSVTSHPSGSRVGPDDEESAADDASPEAALGDGDEQPGPPPQGGGRSEALRERGEIVAVWGPVGSTGRTTLAVNLAAELAALDPARGCLLVDADTYAAGVGQVLGILDEVPGIAVAARAADQGTLDPDGLARLAPEVRPGLRVLTGLPRADRWPEVRDVALGDVLEAATRIVPWTVVDLASPLEQDEELSFDTLAPRRNGAALTVLGAADRVVVVGAGDPVGLQRLVRGLDLVREHATAPQTVVVNRVRPGPVGPDPGRRIREALDRFAGLAEVHLVPEDQDALDTALLQGTTLQECRPRSPARLAIVELAARLQGAPGTDRRPRRRGWLRSRASV